MSKLTYSDFIDIFEGDNNGCEDKNGVRETLDSQYSLIIDLCNEYIKNNYSLQREYKPSNKFKEGRLFVQKYGLQRINSKLRGILCNDLYVDYDMKNAHFSILLYYCRLKNIPSYKVFEYVNFREDKINDVMVETGLSREEIKILFIKTINCEYLTSSYYLDNRKYKIKNSFFIELDKEIKEIQKHVINFNPELKDIIFKTGKRDNLKGRVLNYLLCKYENEILFKSIERLDLKNKKLVVPMFDGFMILKNDIESEEEIINLLNQNEWGIKWTIKSHNLELEDALFSVDISKNDNIISCIFDDLIEASRFMLDTIFNKSLYYCNNRLYYISDYILILDSTVIKNKIYDKLSLQDIWINKGSKKKPLVIKLNSSIRDLEDLRKSIINLSPTNNNLLNDIWLKTKNKLFFKNGYYNFEDHTFNKLNVELPTPHIIERNFNKNSNKKIREEIFKKVLYPLFTIEEIDQDKAQNDLLNFILFRLGRVMGGYIEDKRWLLFQGFRDSGKSLLGDFLKNTFQKYVDFTNVSNFSLGKEDNKSLGWIMDYQFCRLCITQEVPLETKIDGNKIKKFVSGGDTINSRKNFKDEISFKIQASYMMMCNDIPEINPKDTNEKCDKVYMKCKFIDEDFKGTKLNNYKYYKKDDEIKKHFITRDDVMNEFILLLIDYSKKNNLQYPESILKYEAELDDNSDDDVLNLVKYFEEADDAFISNKDLKKFKSDYKVDFTLNKISKLLIGYFKGIERKKINNERGLKNIQIKDEFEE